MIQADPYAGLGPATVIRGDALHLPLPDASVDLICTSPPYWSLRSYQDGGAHYDGQLGSEATPDEFVTTLLAATREMIRVLRPSGSMWVNLGDKYDSGTNAARVNGGDRMGDGRLRQSWNTSKGGVERATVGRPKSLIGVPWRYALRCIDELGLILRAEVIWSKVNGLPESVTDRVRRSHEQWFHFTLSPRYFAAVDEIREPHAPKSLTHRGGGQAYGNDRNPDNHWGNPNGKAREINPLGKLPGSVREVPSAPLKVPASLGVDHFACVDDQTEILTTRGWLRHDQLVEGDTVAGYDLDTKTARWTTCHAVTRYDYDGEMVAVDKRDLSMRLTPNHRTIVQKRTGRHGWRGAEHVVRADELRPQHFIPKSASWDDQQAEKPIGVDFAALCGWVASEGWYDRARVSLSQSLTANPAKVAEIDTLVQRLGGRAYTSHQRTYRGVEWTDCTWRLTGDLAAECRRIMPDKRLTWDMLALPLEERRALFDAFTDGDGHRRADGRIGIFQHLDNRVTVDVLQAIAVTLGYKTSLRKSDRWVLYLTAGGRSITLRGTNGRLDPVGREHYRGTVWCPTTGTGTFVARRRGTVFITGNSFPPAWPAWIIRGWSPAGVCVECGQGRRPVVDKTLRPIHEQANHRKRIDLAEPAGNSRGINADHRVVGASEVTITGYACACPTPDAPTRPAVVLDPFGGTGTTAMAARALGRHGISIDLSADYSRLARWRVQDLDELAAVRGHPRTGRTTDNQPTLLDLLGDPA